MTSTAPRPTLSAMPRRHADHRPEYLEKRGWVRTPEGRWDHPSFETGTWPIADAFDVQCEAERAGELLIHAALRGEPLRPTPIAARRDSRVTTHVKRGQ